MSTIMPSATMQRTVGDVLREWRQRRHLSQLDLATEAEISPRHLSFVETGRANPSRELLLNLADQLRVPLRERNALLVAGGFAPVYQQKSLDDPTLAAAREAVRVMLRCHEPNPALAIDRHWNLVAANRTMEPMLAGVAPELLEPPVNVLRLAMHPGGLASRIVNVQEFGNLLVERLRHEIEISGDPELIDLVKELVVYVRDLGTAPSAKPGVFGIAVPFQLRTEAGILSFFNMTTVFGTATEVTLSELAIESFFPADSATTAVIQGWLAQIESRDSHGETSS